MKEKRSTFRSKLGMVAAAAGSAVGLGNIWRFPSETADGGGAIFIIIYLACILFFGIPLMMAEFLIGRSSKANAAGAFKNWHLVPGNGWADWVSSPDSLFWDSIWWSVAGQLIIIQSLPEA